MRCVACALLNFVLTATAFAAAPATRPAGIHILLSDGVAPCTIHVHALDIALSSGSPLTTWYQWDFGDASATHNTLTGFNAAHTYEREGKYSITLRLTEQTGQVRTFSVALNILPDTRRSIYISSAGDDSERGQSPDHAIRSVEKLKHLLARNTRVFFRRGDTFPIPSSILLTQSNICLASYGKGDRPILQWTGPHAPGNVMIACVPAVHDIVVEDLTFDCAEPSRSGMPDILDPAGTDFTVRNCQFLNVGYAINANRQPHGLMVENCTCPLDDGLREYFVWLDGTDAVIVGNSVANSVYQHDIRGAGYNRALIADNHLVNLDRRNIEPADFSKTCINMQRGANVYITGNTIAKGPIGVGPLGGEDGFKDAPARTKWIVVENNDVTECAIEIHHGAEHVMVRNNIVHLDDARAFNVDGYDDRYQRGLIDAFILNNTAYNNAPHGAFMHLWGHADGITLANNLYVAPKLAVGDEDGAPLAVKNNDFSSFRANRNNVWPTREAPVATESAGAGRGLPEPGVFTDMKGTVRSGSRWSSGAVELNNPQIPDK